MDIAKTRLTFCNNGPTSSLMAVVETFREGETGFGRDKNRQPVVHRGRKVIKDCPLLDFSRFHAAVCTKMPGKWAKLLRDTNPKKARKGRGEDAGHSARRRPCLSRVCLITNVCIGMFVPTCKLTSYKVQYQRKRPTIVRNRMREKMP